MCLLCFQFQPTPLKLRTHYVSSQIAGSKICNRGAKGKFLIETLTVLLPRI